MTECTCIVESCGTPVIAQGRCARHYQQYRVSPDWQPAPPRAPKQRCAVPECTNLEHSKGLCGSHYSRTRRGLDPEALGPLQKKHFRTRCEAPGCQAPHLASGFCREHYAEDRNARLDKTVCAIEDCERPVRTRGWCAAHYQRWLKYGSPTSGPAFRRRRGAGYPIEWYQEQRRRKIGWPSGDTLEYVQILRNDPCAYCGAPMEHIDHIRAVANGGTGDWTNLTAACASCNHRKLTDDLLTFLLKRLTA